MFNLNICKYSTKNNCIENSVVILQRAVPNLEAKFNCRWELRFCKQQQQGQRRYSSIDLAAATLEVRLAWLCSQGCGFFTCLYAVAVWMQVFKYRPGLNVSLMEIFRIHHIEALALPFPSFPIGRTSYFWSTQPFLSQRETEKSELKIDSGSLDLITWLQHLQITLNIYCANIVLY